MLALQVVAERLAFLNTGRCWGAEGRLTPSTDEGWVPRKDGYSGKVDFPSGTAWAVVSRALKPPPQSFLTRTSLKPSLSLSWACCNKQSRTGWL